jgi:itaconyl-CoA hydratase
VSEPVTTSEPITRRGRFFEDFTVGDVFRCRYGRTVTESDNVTFTLLTNNTNQIHFNNDYAARTPFGRCLVNSTLTLAIVTGMGVEDISENGFALGWDEVRMPNPLFPGDTLYSESEVLEARESRSNPTQGIVTVSTRGYNQDGTVVMQFKRTVMVWKRDHAPALTPPAPVDSPSR